MMRNFIFWFCVPWALFLGLAAIFYFVRHPDKLILLLPIIVLLGFATRAEYRKMMAKDNAPLAAARPLIGPRGAGDAARGGATDKAAAPFNPRGPGQFTSFAFRYRLPPGTVSRKTLPPPTDDS